MNNKLTDLNNHLFAEMERLGDESIKGDELKEEIDRAEAMAKVSAQIINNGALVLRAERFRDEAFSADVKIPKFLGGGTK